jgi:site-specific recombinase XerD
MQAFLLTKQVAGCTPATLKAYRWWLDQLEAFTSEPAALTVRTFFAHLQERGLSTSRQHQAYRSLKTFFRWCV